MSEESAAPAEAAPDPLHNRFGELEGRLRQQPNSLPDILAEMSAAGWGLDSSPLTADPLAARACLAVADALAAQAYTLDVAYVWEPAAGVHLFRVAGRPPLVLGLESGFLTREVGPDRARLYVETLMRPLREAAKGGHALVVGSGAMERRPLPAEPTAAG